jgi:hypothetical protein
MGAALYQRFYEFRTFLFSKRGAAVFKGGLGIVAMAALVHVVHRNIISVD